MRKDFSLSVRQFYGGVFLLICSAIIGFFLLKPQWEQYAEEQKNPKDVYYTMPLVSAKQSEQWEENVIKRFKTLSKKSNCDFLGLEGSLDGIKMSKKEGFPEKVGYIPVRIKVLCPYRSFQRLVNQVASDMPVSVIQGISVDNSFPEATLEPEESPRLNGFIHLQLYTRS